MELRMIDAVVEHVAQRLFAIEYGHLILAEQIPPFVDESVLHAVNPLDLVALHAEFGGLPQRGARGDPGERERQQYRADFLRWSHHRPSPSVVFLLAGLAQDGRVSSSVVPRK